MDCPWSSARTVQTDADALRSISRCLKNMTRWISSSAIRLAMAQAVYWAVFQWCHWCRQSLLGANLLFNFLSINSVKLEARKRWETRGKTEKLPRLMTVRLWINSRRRGVLAQKLYRVAGNKVMRTLLFSVYLTEPGRVIFGQTCS